MLNNQITYQMINLVAFEWLIWYLVTELYSLAYIIDLKDEALSFY